MIRERFNKQTFRRFVIAMGPILALVVYALVPQTYVGPQGGLIELGAAGRGTAAVAAWMALWWLTEVVHLSVTALLPLALFPLVGIRSIDEAAAPYADDLIFLFMGGFILSLAMQRWGLHKRIALRTLSVVGTQPRRMVGGFMAGQAPSSAHRPTSFLPRTPATAWASRSPSPAGCWWACRWCWCFCRWPGSF